MSPRVLKFLVEAGSFLGFSLFLLWLFFGSVIEAYWQREPFKFWMLAIALLLLAMAGLAKRALTSFHPGTDEAKSIY